MANENLPGILGVLGGIAVLAADRVITAAIKKWQERDQTALQISQAQASKTLQQYTSDTDRIQKLWDELEDERKLTRELHKEAVKVPALQEEVRVLRVSDDRKRGEIVDLVRRTNDDKRRIRELETGVKELEVEMNRREDECRAQIADLRTQVALLQRQRKGGEA